MRMEAPEKKKPTLWSKLGEELMGYQNANMGVYEKVNYISMM